MKDYKTKGTVNPNKTQLKNFEEFLKLANEDGVLMASKWTTGEGRFTTKRTIPAFCEEFDARKAAHHSRRVAAYLVQHPAVSKVITVDWMAYEMWKNGEASDGEFYIG